MNLVFKLIAPAILLAWAVGAFSIVGVTLMLGLLWALSQLSRYGLVGFFHPRNWVRLVRFFWDFCVDVTVSNIVLAWDVLTPTDLHRVSVIYVPVTDLSYAEIVFLSLRITLTPGTLACDLTEDGRSLIVHAMFPLPEGMDRELRKPIDILKGNR